MAELSDHQAFQLALQQHRAGRVAEAIASYRRAIELKPSFPQAYYNLAIALTEDGKADDAIAAYLQAIALNPKFPQALGNLGALFIDKGRFDEAIAVCRQAIALDPNFAEAHGNLGTALKGKGQLDDAIAAFRRTIALNPKSFEAHYNLGTALQEKDNLDEAIVAYRQAIALNPRFVKAHTNLGNALKATGQFDASISAYQKAIALNSDLPEAHTNLALSLLTLGDFQRGWREFEWRWKLKEFVPIVRNFVQPLWDGSPLEGRTVLLHCERGFGDTLQFIRYLPLVAQRGGRIVVECPAELQRLFRTLEEAVEVIAWGQPLPAFDVHCPLLSLPRIFGTTLTDIPSQVPYLHPDPALVQAWSRTLGPSDGHLRVGQAWAGSPKFQGDRTRSLKLLQLAPLAAARGVKFFSLQKGPAGEQSKNPPAGLELVDLGPQLNDFADTAAVMTLMDLIITTDTSVPHLAGGLGRPVWVMLQFVPDFRWLLDRKDSPWYPSMRLFRQPSRGDWDSVIAEVLKALSHEERSRA